MLIGLYDEEGLVTEAQKKLVYDLLFFAANFLQCPDHLECEVTFISNKEIRTINRDYRGIDAVTDVISFALNDSTEDAESILLFEQADKNFVNSIGDILISVERAKTQADEYGHSLDRELGFLSLHGFLHLMGYDHQNEDDEREMFEMQERILNAYGLERS